MLFIGTQFSNLYTAVDTPARGRVVVCVVLGVCVQVCARTFSGLSASEPPVMPPPAPWLSHFALCPPDLSQTPPQLIQVLPPLYTRPSSHSMGPSPSPSCLAQTSTIYIYNDNLINDNLRNLTKRTNQRGSRTQPSFLTLPLKHHLVI